MSASDDLLTNLIPLVMADLQNAVDQLSAKDVPPAVTAQVMLRLAATIILDIDGPEALSTALSDTAGQLPPAFRKRFNQ